MESLRRLQALAQVNTALAGNGIRMISMKGPLLSIELYGDPSMRTSRDLDVMVAEEDLYELQKKPRFRWEKTFRQLSAQGLGELAMETMLVMYRLNLPGLEDISFDGISLTRLEDGLCLRLPEALEQTGRRALALCEAVYPLWQSETKWGDPRQKNHDRLLPVSLLPQSPLQKLLIVIGPSSYELKLIDLPDWLFWLYFIIRPFNWLRRKLFRK